MKTTTSILLLAPLGAGLLYFSIPAPQSPDADRRPAPFFKVVTQPETDSATIDVARIIETEIEYAPAKILFLETVVSQGSLADKKAAIRELRNLATPDALQALSLALGDEDPRIRKYALEALADIGSDDALAAIASATRAQDARDRARATEALANAGGYSAPKYLELALRDEDPRVRQAAIDALGDIGDSQSVTIISRALRDPDVEVRQRAAEVLDSLGDEALFHALYPRS